MKKSHKLINVIPTYTCLGSLFIYQYRYIIYLYSKPRFAYLTHHRLPSYTNTYLYILHTYLSINI